ncbi:MAG: hypothetical protein IT442_04465, partial [Phycisphaeraceae bacterium]|nr:hypothetical protein [Phycisphaeraceae bacterium]
YISDAEMSKHDAGLAGIVITSHRLIFHKYHSHGEISLNEEASLIVRRSGITATISVENASGRYKLGKLSAKDVATLIDAMSHAPKIRLTVTTAEASPEAGG